jgi:hypothetical protein
MNIFHVLDLCLCGALKKRGQYELSFSDDDEAARFTTKVYHNFRQEMIEVNIYRAFGELEFLNHIVSCSMSETPVKSKAPGRIVNLGR